MYVRQPYETKGNICLLLCQVFLNIVLDEATESKPNNEKVRLGMCVIRGNSVVMMEALDRIGDDHQRGPR